MIDENLLNGTSAYDWYDQKY